MRGKFGVREVFCLVAVLPPHVLSAQLTTSTVYGRVTDANGGTITGAQVALTNTDTNLSRTAQTNAEGEYSINGKDPNLTGNSSAERAELVPGQNPVLSNRTTAEWFNIAAFSQNPKSVERRSR